MKRITCLVVVVMVALSGMAVAQLMTSATIVAEVPFQFTVANKVVPAGECEVRAITTDGRTLVIRNTEAKVSLVSMFSQTEGKQTASGYALVFNRYGDRYFLSGIQLRGSLVTYRLPESTVEAELRAATAEPTQETLLAVLK
jgi:hypothetical protein